MSALGQNGTTGGAGGTTVTVDTTDELLEAIDTVGAMVILVEGTIDITSKQGVRPNKTILGVGDDAAINGGGFDFYRSSNVIIRNLTFANAEDDAVGIGQESHHIWIDHNTFVSPADGSIDIVAAGRLRHRVLEPLRRHRQEHAARPLRRRLHRHRAPEDQHPPQLLRRLDPAAPAGAVRRADPRLQQLLPRQRALRGRLDHERAACSWRATTSRTCPSRASRPAATPTAAPGRLVAARQHLHRLRRLRDRGLGRGARRPTTTYTLDDPATLPTTVPAGAGAGNV